MKQGKKLIGLVIAVILGLSLILIPVLNLTSPAEAAVTWTKSGEVTLENEKYVIDSWVIKDGATYRMWYTHGKKDMALLDLIDAIAGLNLDLVIDSIESRDAESFLADLADLEGDVGVIADLLDGISTVIGYATSTNGITWTVVNSEVLAGSGGAWDSIGSPSVIWDTTDSEYKMWYTRLKTDVDQTALGNILLDMDGNEKAAILDLLDGTHTVIGYATSPDGITWTVEDAEVLAGNGQAVNSVGAASVIKDGATYKMWYTQGESDFTESDIDDILADITDFGLVVSDVLAILDSSSTVIRYATSTNGTTWTSSNPIVLTGSGAVWDNVADPSVIKSGSTYEMWHTQGETNLVAGTLLSLIDEITVDLGPGLLTIWDDLQNKSLADFIIEDVLALDITNIENILSSTNAVIGYATSSDGITWTPQIAPDLIGSSSPWGSVVAPTVVKTGSDYQMWFTEGIADLTWQNIIDLVFGDNLPIGYAYYTAPAPPPSPPPVIDTALFGIEVDFSISSTGEILGTIVAISEDENLTMTILEGTIALDEEGEPLTTITVELDETPPDPPEDAHLIGLVYDFGPAGATFDPPLTLEYTYDPDALPEGVTEEDLVIAYYDEETGEWVELPSVVDTVTHTVTGLVAHFTTLAIITMPPVVVPPVGEEVVPQEEEEDEVVIPPVGEEEEEEIVPQEVTKALAWWLWLVIGLASAAVVGSTVWLVLVRRRSS